MLKKQTHNDKDVAKYYRGELVEDKVLEHHRKVNEEPTAWKALLENISEGCLYFKCTVCEARFRLLDSFISHANKHTGEKTFMCRLPRCPRAYDKWDALKVHLLKHLGKRKFICETCKATFKNLSSLYRHTKSQHGTLGPYSVEGMGNDTHENIFENEDPFLEELEEFHRKQRYDSQTWRQMTLIIEKGNRNNSYQCKSCGLITKKKDEHIDHVVEHTGEKHWKCKVINCTEAFGNWLELKEHLKIHYHGKKYSCDICGLEFATKLRRDKHRPIHRLGKRYQCQYCSAVFRRPYQCKYHEKRHKPNDETLRACDLCDKAFLNSVMLNNHKLEDHGVTVPKGRRRGNSSVFTCKECLTSFNEETAYRDHKDICCFIINKKLQCRFCSKTFTDVETYQEHEENAHDDQWKLLLITKMKDIYNEFELEAEESGTILPSALQVAQQILDESTPMWRKS